MLNDIFAIIKAHPEVSLEKKSNCKRIVATIKLRTIRFWLIRHFDMFSFQFVIYYITFHVYCKILIQELLTTSKFDRKLFSQ